MVAVFAVTVLGSLLLLGLSMWPGVVEDGVLQIPFCCATFPLLVAWTLLVECLGVRDLLPKPWSSVRGRWWGLLSVLVMTATVALVWLNVPRRLAFAACYPQFAELVDSTPIGDNGGHPLGRQLGPYWVDRYAADERGGVYFRTHAGPDGIGPDTMSYRFAFRPNVEGTPFGGTACRYGHLFGEWYTFAVSND
jgi:hypothetical protein